VANQSGVTVVDVVGKDKNYFFNANWWKAGAYNQQTEDQVGLSFTISNPANAGSPDNDPAGYPSFYIGGSYSGRSATKGSNLPKQVSALKSVNTILSTNANSKGRSNYNAAYDVWFTSSSSALPKTQYNPGTGGAYMMVWLFMPSDRQPRGSKRTTKSINGVPGSWDVWVDSTNPPCISYVHSSGVETLDFDLNKFIQDSVTSNYGITSSMYLYLVFAGFEVWRGGNGLEMKAFCADVQ
jgi:cellulose 1,4-beta-cellobiosidase